MIKNHQRKIAELENAISKLKISRGVQQQTRSSRNRDQWIQSSLKSHWVREAKKEWKKKKSDCWLRHLWDTTKMINIYVMEAWEEERGKETENWIK